MVNVTLERNSPIKSRFLNLKKKKKIQTHKLAETTSYITYEINVKHNANSLLKSENTPSSLLVIVGDNIRHNIAQMISTILLTSLASMSPYIIVKRKSGKINEKTL